MDGSLVHRRRKNFQSFCTTGVWHELLRKRRINAIRKETDVRVLSKVEASSY